MSLAVGLPIFVVAVLMTMVGKGGGNFYIVILTFAGIQMHEAAATGQFILFFAAVAATVIFNKHKSVSWKLALIIGGVTSASALAGGLFSHYFSGFSLKIFFAGMLFLSGLVMIVPLRKKDGSEKNRSLTIPIKIGEQIYSLNALVVIPITILTGFGSGMVGVSGGSFLVPLMVLSCGVPMQVAVGTSSILIAATALTGFAGHAIQGDFNPEWAIPLAIVTVVGGIIGGKFALKSKPKSLKKIFAYTNWIAAGFMILNAINSKNG